MQCSNQDSWFLQLNNNLDPLFWNNSWGKKFHQAPTFENIKDKIFAINSTLELVEDPTSNFEYSDLQDTQDQICFFKSNLFKYHLKGFMKPFLVALKNLKILTWKNKFVGV